MRRLIVLNKIKTYIGFAKKSRALNYGIDNIKNPKLIIISNELAASSKSQAEKEAKKYNCNIIEISQLDMNYLLDSENIKAISINNKDLASAIEKVHKGELN